MKNVMVMVGAITAALLMTSTASAAERPIDEYGPSSYIYPELGNLKNQNDCPTGTKFFKNVAPGLTNGTSEGPTTASLDFSIDGEIVTMSITWFSDNSFDFTLTGGIAHIVGVTSDTNNLLYDYVDYYNPTPETDTYNRVVGGVSNTPVFADENLNSIEFAADVNHLDLCLAKVDTTPPVITFISPQHPTDPPGPPEQVSGTTVPIIVTVTDLSSGVDPDSVTASIYQDDVLIEDLGIGQPQTDGTYTWEWKTVDPLWEPPELPAGLYTIKVTAADLAVGLPVANTETVEVTVELVKSLADCFGLLDDTDFDPDSEGCKPTPLVRVQVNPDTEICNPDLTAPQPPDPNCFISGKLLKPDPLLNSIDPADQDDRDILINNLISLYGGCDACDVGYCGDGLPDPRMKCTLNVDGECEWTPRTPLKPLYIADVAEGSPPGVLGKYVYGNKGCFVGAQHSIGAALPALYEYWPAFGLVFIKVFGEAECNVGGPDAAQAGYQPIGKNRSIDTLENGTVDDTDQLNNYTAAITLAATQKCNAPRTLTRDNGIDVSDIIETDGSDDPVAFKYQMAQMQFDGLFVALGCAEPDFNRGRIKFSDVTSPINQAKAQFDNGTIAALGRARDDLWVAADAIRDANWNVTEDNCAGDALARTENLAWRMCDLIIAQDNTQTVATVCNRPE